MKIIRKLITLLLIITILAGCAVKNNDTPVSADNASFYLQQIETFEPYKKNKNNTEDNKEFEEFEDEVFKTIVSMDYLTMNSNVSDYKALGIKKPERKIFKLKYGDTSDAEIYKGILEKLYTFDYDSLSYRQQYDYDCIRYDMLVYITGVYFKKYEQVFNISNDYIGNAITNLTEFRFTDKESIDDFIELLNSFPECCKEAIEFTREQVANGIGYTDRVIKNNTEMINSFINKITENPLLVNFNSRIDELNLDIDKDAYKAKVKSIFIETVIPALKEVREELKSYKGTTDESSVLLCNIDKDFAKYKFYVTVSSNEDPQTFFNELKEVVIKEKEEADAGTNDPEALLEYTDIKENGLDIINRPYEEVLEFLKENSKKAYPDIGDIPYTISKTDGVQEQVLAYYVPMPVDKIEGSKIKINENNVEDGTIDLYTTLAHEGIPGHLYQFYYYAKTNPSKFRMLVYELTYCEGHTVTAQREALNWLGIKNQKVIDMLKYDTSGYFMSNSLIDIGMHLFGYSVDDVRNLLNEVDSDYSESKLESAYKYLAGCPAMYLNYGAGALNFARLRNYAQEALKDKFDLVKFNETLLKNGPLPYALLKCAVDEYIEENK